MPDVPTFGETLPSYERSGWNGVLAPRGTSPVVIDRLSTEVAKALQSPEVHRQLADQGVEPVGSTPSAFAALIKKELEAYRQLLKAVGMYMQGAAAM